MSKRVILSDSSLNRYGYRVLTEGIDLEAFKKNPILLYMHFRDEGSPYWGTSKAIGHWEDIRVDGDQLSAVPVFDKVDELSTTIAAKFEAGTYRAASIGIHIIETSSDKSVVVLGQTRETVTRCELMEASIVDVPANANAVRLYDGSSSAVLAAGQETNVVPVLKPNGMNLKSSWKSVLAFLGVGEDKADNTVLSAENMDALNAEFGRIQAEHASLVQAKKDVDDKLAASVSEVAQLKKDIGDKDSEIVALKEQVENLKKKPVDDEKKLAPASEPDADEKKDLAAFCEEVDSKDYAAMSARLKEEGLL